MSRPIFGGLDAVALRNHSLIPPSEVLWNQDQFLALRRTTDMISSSDTYDPHWQEWCSVAFMRSPLMRGQVVATDMFDGVMLDDGLVCD